MISVQDQEELFMLIADYLDEDIECVAIGGTAMMFHGYKATTKNIDLVFKSSKDREVFIRAVEKLGYSQSSLRFVYDEKRLKSRSKPLVYSRGDERFDLFAGDVFGFDIDFGNFVQRHDYIGKKELIVFTAPKEYLILLKCVTNREKDYEDIETIVKTEINADWKAIIELAASKREQVPWILIDLEEKMRKLKKIAFIKQEYFTQLYKFEEKAAKKQGK